MNEARCIAYRDDGAICREPVPTEAELVRRVEALFNLGDTIERRVTAGRQRADKLTQAVLAKAFRGEPVPTEGELARRERRSYEPASLLLERIRAEHEAAAATSATKSKQRGKRTSHGRNR